MWGERHAGTAAGPLGTETRCVPSSGWWVGMRRIEGVCRGRREERNHRRPLRGPPGPGGTEEAVSESGSRGVRRENALAYFRKSRRRQVGPAAAPGPEVSARNRATSSLSRSRDWGGRLPSSLSASESLGSLATNLLRFGSPRTNV